jgi:hypothetical protein
MSLRYDAGNRAAARAAAYWRKAGLTNHAAILEELIESAQRIAEEEWRQEQSNSGGTSGLATT